MLGPRPHRRTDSNIPPPLVDHVTIDDATICHKQYCNWFWVNHPKVEKLNEYMLSTDSQPEGLDLTRHQAFNLLLETCVNENGNMKGERRNRLLIMFTVFHGQQWDLTTALLFASKTCFAVFVSISYTHATL